MLQVRNISRCCGSWWSPGPCRRCAGRRTYGKLLQPANNSNAAGDYVVAAKTLVDLEARAKFHGFELALGADNLFDTYPTQPPYVLNGVTLSSNGVGDFPEYSPYGFDGRFVYGRISYSW